MRLTRYNHFDYSLWHDWYAWRPVYIKKYGWVWLETVERKHCWDSDDWANEYRVKL